VTPYYHDEAAGVTLYHGDCREVLPALAESAFDVVLTDPPYNLGIDYGEEVDDAKGDYPAWCRQWFPICRGIADTVAVTPGVANLGL
jgi:DNA modification methylase